MRRENARLAWLVVPNARCFARMPTNRHDRSIRWKVENNHGIRLITSQLIFLRNMSQLFAWLGNADIAASRDSAGSPPGPICSAIKALPFSALHLISDHGQTKTDDYVVWLERQTGISATKHFVRLASPTNHEDIYIAARNVLENVANGGNQESMTFHLSPGTPAMASIWVLLAKTRFPAMLIESSISHGVKAVNIPFELAAEFIPTERADELLTRLAQGMPPDSPEFAAIIHRCPVMKRTVSMAHRFAMLQVPVLIQGESGTGKELFARAVHNISSRRSRNFVAVNCGAIPTELVDSELFGHEKGAFSGAVSARAGYFESADGGTIFLDEVGELPLASQVRLLRVLQEREVTRLGATKARPLDVRVISATNRILTDEIRQGRFREDLYHRLAVGVLLLPPLRKREGDLNLLIDALMKQINTEANLTLGQIEKKLDAGARNLLLRHSWPGNVRELQNVLLRAAVFSSSEKVTAQDVAESLAIGMPPEPENIMGRSLDRVISLRDIMAEVASHYLNRAMLTTNGNKTEAARLLGLGSHQNLANWIRKYGA